MGLELLQELIEGHFLPDFFESLLLEFFLEGNLVVGNVKRAVDFDRGFYSVFVFGFESPVSEEVGLPDLKGDALLELELVEGVLNELAAGLLLYFIEGRPNLLLKRFTIL